MHSFCGVLKMFKSLEFTKSKIKQYMNFSNFKSVKYQKLSFYRKKFPLKDCTVGTGKSKLFNGKLKNKLSLTAYSSTSCSPPPEKCNPGRYNFHDEIEQGINDQILMELNACYTYLSMAYFFARNEIALPGFQTFFMCMHYEEHEHALSFMNYQILRGGHVKLCSITAPGCQDWGCIGKALETSLEMEKSVKDKLMVLYGIADKHKDFHFSDMITSQFLPDQDYSICELARLWIRATKMSNTPEGEFLFDKEVFNVYHKKCKDCKSVRGTKLDEYI